MRISRLSLSNVGPFDDATLVFPEPKSEGEGELVLFEGPNGSGKTTLAEVIALLIGPSIAQRGYDEETLTSDPFSKLIPRFRASPTFDATIDHRGSSLVATGRYGNPRVDCTGAAEILAVINAFNAPASSDSHKLTWAAFLFHARMPSAKLAAEGPRKIAEDPRTSALGFEKRWPAAEALGQLAINLEFERVQYAQYAAEQPAEATRFHEAAEARKRALAWFELAFSKLLARKVTFVFEPGRLSPKMFFDGEELPLDQLGEGMRGTVAWLADLLVRLERIPWIDETRSPWEQEFWLILDEIEASLHPKMQMRILPALRELFPRARIYATTHSPFVVASAGEGHVFCLRPHATTHRVSGVIESVKLEPGQSLEWVVASIFDAPTGIVDHETRDAIEEHQREVDALRRGDDVDWTRFLSRRDRLVALNDEVAAIVRITEAPVRKVVEARLLVKAA
jgi:energy-coupling factor transporter ATP-binding protein EcfA2